MTFDSSRLSPERRRRYDKVIGLQRGRGATDGERAAAKQAIDRILRAAGIDPNEPSALDTLLGTFSDNEIERCRAYLRSPQLLKKAEIPFVKDFLQRLLRKDADISDFDKWLTICHRVERAQAGAPQPRS